MADNGTLTRNQTKAVSALLVCQTVAEAAALAGVSERTLYRWMEQDDFRAALKDAANQTIAETVRRLTAGREAALDTLYDLMTGAEKESDRRLAAVSWLSVDRDTRELEVIEDRLSALEKVVLNGNR